MITTIFGAARVAVAIAEIFIGKKKSADDTATGVAKFSNATGIFQQIVGILTGIGVLKSAPDDTATKKELEKAVTEMKPLGLDDLSTNPGLLSKLLGFGSGAPVTTSSAPSITLTLPGGFAGSFTIEPKS